ncbi:hypothetical protein [Marinobacter sp.]|uniref:hypothetical protein n=1 Tax=Marinobacter sp. TaxID=50741 RepID=UPI0035C73F6F
MSSLVMEIEDYALSAGVPLPVSRAATYFLLMTGSDVDIEFSYKGSRIGGGVGLQGGDAVGPLSQMYDQVTLTSATSQTVKIATSSDPVTITRLSGTVQIAGTVVTNSVPDDTWPAFSMLRTATSNTGNYPYSVFRNPAGSGKDALIQIMGMSPQAAGNHYIAQADSIPEIADGIMFANAAPHDFERGESSVILTYSSSTGLASPITSQYTWVNSSGFRKVDFSGNEEFQLKRPIRLTPGRDLVFYSSTAEADFGSYIEYEERDR